MRGVRLSRTPSGPAPVCGGMGAVDGCDYRPTPVQCSGEGKRTAAAAVSTVAYTTVFISNLLAYRRVTGLAWRSFADLPHALRRSAA